jgi:hypothetical protein
VTEIERPPGTWDRDVVYREIAQGRRSVIATDDTAASGMPGSNPTRKAHAAIAVTMDKTAVVLKDVIGLWEMLKAACGAEHFHFKEMFSAKGPFVGLTMTQRLAALYRFVELFNRYEIPIWVSQFDPDKIAQISDSIPQNQTPAQGNRQPFRWDDPVNLSRWAALTGALQFVGRDPSNLPASAFMDRVDARVRDWCPVGQDDDGNPTYSLAPLDPPAVFGDYNWFNPYVQLADFAAWSYTRLENIDARMPLAEDADWDRVVLSVLRPVLSRYQFGPDEPDKWDRINNIVSVPFIPREDELDGWWGRGMQVWRMMPPPVPPSETDG